ncbi:zinc finger domain-containing protein [Streptomyces cinereoruber]|uniref:zinc finger domain-containing protein n=1 Tax=Streptomyces cinereoruber TaxID=67260 RepID=UPI0036415F14
MTSPQIQQCEHSRRPGRIEAPAITAMVAAMAHLKDALAADPRDTAAFYTDGHGQHPVPGWIRGNADRIRGLLDQLVVQYPDDKAPDAPGVQDLTPDQAPALNNPALAVACPACDAKPRTLCTSHSGTRPRRHDVHRARTAALAATR